MFQTEIKVHIEFLYKLAFACLTTACLFALASTALAATDAESDSDDYTDSVYSWGIWELGLEPASGPEITASTALNDRSRKLHFRPNDNAAFIPESIPLKQFTPTTPVPVPAPTPVISVGGTGPILPGMVPNSPNLR